MKKILVISLYYRPDLSAGSFRTTALIDELKNEKVSIDVITTFPNRYSTYTEKSKYLEENENVSINRIKLPYPSTSFLNEIKNFIYFYFKSHAIAKNLNCDLVYATSSRLFTAFLGARISHVKKVPLYLDIRDLFLDTLSSILPKIIYFLSYVVIKPIELYTFHKAKKINIVSGGFKRMMPKNKDLSIISNGIDDVFLVKQPSKKQPDKIKKILYAGNIGDGQGLHNIIPKLAKRLDKKFLFTIIGDGKRKDQLISLCKANKVENVIFINPLSRSELIKHYYGADILFLHLNNMPAFKKVIPSKIFEYASTGKPIFAGIDGYAKHFMEEEVMGSICFQPCNDKDAEIKLKNLVLKDISRDDFIEKYKRSKLMKVMAKDVYNCTQITLKI